MNFTISFPLISIAQTAEPYSKADWAILSASTVLPTPDGAQI